MTEASDPAAAMAADAAMLADAERGQVAIRLYRWTGICVTLGRFQDPTLALLDPAMYAWAHRPTGGSAVLHGHDVTLSAAIPLNNTATPRIRAVYMALTGVVIDFLAANGVLAAIAEPQPPGGSRIPSQACFATSAPFDLIDAEGHKVCGCALRISRRAALLQTSIPVSPPAVEPDSVIVGATRPNIPSIDLFNTEIEALPSWQRLNCGAELFAR
ncbi:MAG: lipoyl protein ligase domain-containing protein [Fimbriimonadaceae bacterium]